MVAAGQPLSGWGLESRRLRATDSYGEMSETTTHTSLKKKMLLSALHPTVEDWGLEGNVIGQSSGQDGSRIYYE